MIDTKACWRAYEELRERGVVFDGPPDKRPWGVHAVLRDLYGNRFALVEPNEP